MTGLKDDEDDDSVASRDEAYELAKEHALAMLRQGFHLGGGPYPSRDELHDRRPEKAGDAAPEPIDEAPK